MGDHRMENYLMNNNLMMVPEETEENEEIVVVAEINNSISSVMEQSKFWRLTIMPVKRTEILSICFEPTNITIFN